MLFISKILSYRSVKPNRQSNAKGDDPPNFLKVQFQLEIEILYQAAMGHLSPTIHSFQHTEIGILQE